MNLNSANNGTENVNESVFFARVLYTGCLCGFVDTRLNQWVVNACEGKSDVDNERVRRQVWPYLVIFECGLRMGCGPFRYFRICGYLYPVCWAWAILEGYFSNELNYWYPSKIFLNFIYLFIYTLLYTNNTIFLNKQIENSLFSGFPC